MTARFHGYLRSVFEPSTTGPHLPSPVGPLSRSAFVLISSAARGRHRAVVPAGFHDQVDAIDDPLGDDDLNLALYVLYGLHYRSFADVDDAWEWNPAVVAMTAALERRFADALETEVRVPEVENPEETGESLFRLEAADDGAPLSRHLEFESTVDEFREFLIHRSAYQLKEADPHSWAIPRLTGAPKTAMLEVQFDEYGSGRPERMHSRLFAKTMKALDLDTREDVYLPHLPGSTLATVNLMTWLGLHRANRGGLVGHLAMFEMTSSKPNRSYGNGLRRLGFGEEATDFFDEHVEADAVHENIAAFDMAGGLARSDPSLARDILFGAAALLHVEARFAGRLLAGWQQGLTTLRREEVPA